MHRELSLICHDGTPLQAVCLGDHGQIAHELAASPKISRRHDARRQLQSSPAAMQFADDFGYRIVDLWNLPQPVLVHDSLQRLGQRGEGFSRTRIGAGTVIIVARQGRAAPEFDQKPCNGHRIKFRHINRNKGRQGPFSYISEVLAPIILGTFTRRNGFGLNTA
jgi:hypothetical protein